MAVHFNAKASIVQVHIYLRVYTLLTDVIVASSDRVSPHWHCTAGDNTDNNISSIASASWRDMKTHFWGQYLKHFMWAIYRHAGPRGDIQADHKSDNSCVSAWFYVRNSGYESVNCVLVSALKNWGSAKYDKTLLCMVSAGGRKHLAYRALPTVWWEEIRKNANVLTITSTYLVHTCTCSKLSSSRVSHQRSDTMYDWMLS